MKVALTCYRPYGARTSTLPRGSITAAGAVRSNQ
nr:MAG TPA: hypothetical protein [Caudoviricetes sp.]